MKGMTRYMDERIFSRENLGVLNRRLANEKLTIHLPEMDIHVVWLSFSKAREERAAPASVPHRHSFFETHLYVQGSITYQVEGQRYTASAGKVLFFGCEVPHLYVEDTRDYCKISLAFGIVNRGSPQAALMLDALSQHPVLVTDYDPEMLHLFAEILDEADAQQPCYLEAIKARLFAIIVDYIRLLGKGSFQQVADKTQRIDSRIAEIDKYVHSHMREQVTLEAIARHIHISTKQINRILQRDFNLTGRDYVDRLKCEQAKDMLLHTDMTLEEIAAATGYANVFSFIKFFRRVEGLPPGLFRKSHYSY